MKTGIVINKEPSIVPRSLAKIKPKNPPIQKKRYKTNIKARNLQRGIFETYHKKIMK